MFRKRPRKAGHPLQKIDVASVLNPGIEFVFRDLHSLRLDFSVNRVDRKRICDSRHNTFEKEPEDQRLPDPKVLDEILEKHRIEISLKLLVLERHAFRQRYLRHAAHSVECIKRNSHLRLFAFQMARAANPGKIAVLGKRERERLELYRPTAKLGLHLL